MIAVRQQDGQQLMSETGETTRYTHTTHALSRVVLIWGNKWGYGSGLNVVIVI